MIVIADFDRTISRYRTSRGAPVTTSHGVIENCELLDETYRKKARDLADYYIPKEFDASSSEEERTKVCEEWWSKAHDLLLEYGLTRQQLEDAVRNETNLELREGCEEMFRMLEKNGVPLLIFSAGLGDVIETFLRTKVFARTGKIPSNIHIISNRMRFETVDLDGWKDDFDTSLLGDVERTGKIKPSNIKIDRLVGSEGEIIHSCNKGLTPMRELEAKGVFKNRTTALLLGDSVGDVHMADWLMGSGYVRDVLKVGFLNHDVEKNLATYEKIYDHVIKNDGDMYFPIALVRNLVFKQEKRKKKLSVDVTSDKVTKTPDKVIYVSKSSETSEKDLTEEEKRKIRFEEDEERRALLEEIQNRRQKFLKSRLELKNMVESKFRVEDQERHRLMREIRKRERNFLSPSNASTPRMMKTTNIVQQDIQRRRDELIHSNNSALNRDFMTHPREYHTMAKPRNTVSPRTPERNTNRGQYRGVSPSTLRSTRSSPGLRSTRSPPGKRGTQSLRSMRGIRSGDPSPRLNVGNKYFSST